MTARVVTSGRRGLKGKLHLVCGIDPAGRSYLKKQAFSVPFHIGKSFSENGVLLLNLVTPTAGLLKGDVMESLVRVEAGARLQLVSPAATRVHDTEEGWSEVVQDYSVQSGGWLEILPDLFIPQRGARHRQRTQINVEPGGELCFLEMIAPGRVAFGEIFAFALLDWQTEIRLGSDLVARERFILSSGNPTLRSLKEFSPHTYVATFFIITDRLHKDSHLWREIDALHGTGFWIGSSALVKGGWVIKIMAGDGARLRAAIAAIRHELFSNTGWPLPATRRI